MKKRLSIFISGIIRSELLKSASVLISGTVIAQLISIFLQPVLRRLFLPEDFGIYSVYLSIVGIIVILTTFRYDDAIVLPKSDKESTNVVFLSLMINLILNGSVLIFFLGFEDNILTYFNLPENFPIILIYIIPVGAFLFNCNTSLMQWLIRRKRYFAVSYDKMIRRSSEGAAQLGFAALKTTNGLIISDLIGHLSNLILVSIQTYKNGLNFRLINISKLKYVVKKYSDFPRYNLIPSLMSTCSYLLPPVFINKYYSSQNAGYFDLSKLVLSIPLALIASSLGNVLLQKVSEKYNKNESFLDEIKPVIIIVSLISIIEIVSISLFGEHLFSLVFGKQWFNSGKIAKIMVWSFALSFVVSTFSNVFISLRKIKTYSLWQAFYFLSIMSLFMFRHLAFMEFLKIYVLVEVICFLIMGFVLILIIRDYESSLKNTSNR